MGFDFCEERTRSGHLKVSWQADTRREWSRMLKALKEYIPKNERSFDPDKKQWTISPSHIDTYDRVKDAVEAESLDELDTNLDEAITEEAILSTVDSTLLNLPESMRKRALFAIKTVVGMIDAPVEYCASKDMFGAWSEEANRWMYEDGRYSTQSPQEKDAKAEDRAWKRADRMADRIPEILGRLDDERGLQWKALFRARMLREYDEKCFVCGWRPKNTSKLDMHRVLPGKDGGEYNKDNVVILCRSCHRSHEGESWEAIIDARENRISQ